jgi:hypothetical protein
MRIGARLCATRATAFVATRQITPPGLGLLCGPIDEGVDCLGADVRSRASFPDFNQPEICSGVHPSAGRSPTNRRRRPVVRGSLHAASAIDRLRRREAARSTEELQLLQMVVFARPSTRAMAPSTVPRPVFVDICE